MNACVVDINQVALSCGEIDLGVDAPKGALRWLRYAGADILRPADSEAVHPLDLSSFVLAPFANRIAYGTFRSGDQAVTLPIAEVDRPHALHGLAWRARWEVVSVSPTSVVLRTRAPAGAWPWAHETTQSVAIDAHGVTLALRIVNESRSPMPASFGFHPYFARPANMWIVSEARAMWLTDSTLLPLQRSAPPHGLAAGIAVADLAKLDHCLTGWSRQARLSVPGRAFDVVVTSSDTLGFLHIYRPDGADFICLEPVSAIPDSFNRPEPPEETGLRLIEPGAECRAEMRIAFAPPA